MIGISKLMRYSLIIMSDMKCTYQGIQSEDVQNNEQNPCHNCISGSNSDNRTCGDSSKPSICRQIKQSKNKANTHIKGDGNTVVTDQGKGVVISGID